MKFVLTLCTTLAFLLPFHSAAQTSEAEKLATQLYPLVLRGDAAGLERTFAVEPRIDTPRTGPLRGVQMWQRFVTQEADWFKSMGARPETLKTVKTTKAAGRIVHEMVISLATPERMVPFKLAVVVDDVDGSASAARVYYAYAATPGKAGFLRQSILPPDPSVRATIAAPVRKYFDAIEASDQFAWKLYAPDGFFNGGSSTPLVGTNLKKFFAVLGGEPGGVPLRPATVTCDDGTCAIEENLATWGSIVFERDTAGLAVYDFDSARGLIIGARVYDDLPESAFGKPGWIHKNWAAISSALEKSGCRLTYAPTADASPAQVRREYFGAPCTQN